MGDKIINISTVSQAHRIAEKYAQKNNLTLGEYEKDVKYPLGGSGYCFSADDPSLAGQIVGLPLHICVDDLGTAFDDRFI